MYLPSHMDLYMMASMFVNDIVTSKELDLTNKVLSVLRAWSDRARDTCGRAERRYVSLNFTS